MKILVPRFFRKPQLNHALSSFLIIAILIIVADSSALGQADKCSKPKKAVKLSKIWRARTILQDEGVFVQSLIPHLITATGNATAMYKSTFDSC
jgi:hypothetical protein